VVSQSATAWVIAVAGPATSAAAAPVATNTTVKIDTSTKIVGSPVVGDTVDVLATKQSDGSLLATLITKVVVPPPTVSLRGTVVSESATAWVIAVTGPSTSSAAAPVVTKTTVKVDSSTKIVGSPVVGDTVEVLAAMQSDGSLLAAVITKVEFPKTVVFEGVVSAINGMEWTVGTTSVLVTPMTARVGSPKLGDRVKVEGVQVGSLPVVATKITKL
jgi:hypothetical protein